MLSVLMVTLWPYVWYILIHCIPWNLARIAVNCEACQATDDEPKQWSTQGNSIGWNHDVSEAEIKGSQRISKGDDMWWLMTKTMKQLNLWIVKVCEGMWRYSPSLHCFEFWICFGLCPTSFGHTVNGDSDAYSQKASILSAATSLCEGKPLYVLAILQIHTSWDNFRGAMISDDFLLMRIRQASKGWE